MTGLSFSGPEEGKHARQPEGQAGERRKPLTKMVWGGGNDQDWGTPGLERAKPAAARVLNTQLTLGRASQGAQPRGVSGHGAMRPSESGRAARSEWRGTGEGVG